MSFRELRSFTEIMRALGYPRPISMENFRTPNFPLVAEITDWLVLRYEPGAKIPEDIDTESQRVAFVTAVAQVLASKARLSIKTKHLYAADGRAVREMLKIAKLLNSAVRTCQEAAAAGEEAEGERDGPGLSSAVRPSDLAATRTVASEITERGAKLYELLRREHELREARAAALSFLDGVGGGEDGGGSGTGVTGGSLGEQQAKLERVVRDAIANMKDAVAALQAQRDELREDESTLEDKIKKKQAELLRNQKRLESLQAVRPAFMDEYERLERELADEYDAYVTRWRNLDYLEHEVDAAAAAEAAASAEGNAHMKKLQAKLRDEERRLFRGEGEEDEGDASDGEGEGGDRAGAGAGGGAGRGNSARSAGSGGVGASGVAASSRPAAAAGGVRGASASGGGSGSGSGSGVPPRPSAAAGGVRGPTAAAAAAATAAAAAAIGAGGGARVYGRMDAADDDDEDDEDEDDEAGLSGDLDDEEGEEEEEDDDDAF